jgi:hypothetical protein
LSRGLAGEAEVFGRHAEAAAAEADEDGVAVDLEHREVAPPRAALEDRGAGPGRSRSRRGLRVGGVAARGQRRGHGHGQIDATDAPAVHAEALAQHDEAHAGARAVALAQRGGDGVVGGDQDEGSLTAPRRRGEGVRVAVDQHQLARLVVDLEPAEVHRRVAHRRSRPHAAAAGAPQRARGADDVRDRHLLEARGPGGLQEPLGAERVELSRSQLGRELIEVGDGPACGEQLEERAHRPHGIPHRRAS